jgi:hypothetical protein
VEPIKGAKHLKSTDDKCPVDGTKLDLYSIFSMEFEGCPKCHGMWLVKDEFRKLKNKALEGRLHWLASMPSLNPMAANWFRLSLGNRQSSLTGVLNVTVSGSIGQSSIQSLNT